MITTNEAPSSGATIRYPNVRIGGLWLLVIGLTVVLATVLGGPLPLNWGIFALGFVGGMLGVWTNPISPRQRRARLLAFVFLGILLLGCFLPFGLVDGLLKLGFGILMLIQRPAR